MLRAVAVGPSEDWPWRCEASVDGGKTIVQPPRIAQPTNEWKAPEFDLSALASGRDRVLVRITITNPLKKMAVVLSTIEFTGKIE